MKSYLFIYFHKPISIFIFLILTVSYLTDFLNAEESNLKDMQIDSSTKFEGESLDLPTNPFEIVEMIRRANSLNDATNPSDAIDDALKSFYVIDETDKI